MKERIVEDWLTRINERGYQTSFGQILAAAGHTVLRISHSPYEHGKDVLTIDPRGEVHAFQLKDGNIGLKEWEKGFAQICALVETFPVHPSIPDTHDYRPWLVTNGVFSDPALDRIRQHNLTWKRRGLPALGIRDGRWMQRELLGLSSDFWPSEPPDVRLFRSLYLVDGRGDFDPEAFNRFVDSLLVGEYARKDLERRVASANIFCSYILGEFYKQGDHWSVFRGWMLTATAIARAYLQSGLKSDAIQASLSLARDAAEEALGSLARECNDLDSFKPERLEWDEYTRVRNAVALGGWATWCLLNLDEKESAEKFVSTFKNFMADARIAFWGEGAFPFICAMAWLLEQHGEIQQSEHLFIEWLIVVVKKQQPGSENPLPDPYVSADQVLELLANRVSDDALKRRNAIQSYCLLPLVSILVRRNRRELLSEVWNALSRVTISVFKPDTPVGYLEWRCERGIESDFVFQQPQSYRELDELASNPPVERLPAILREDLRFRLMFLLAFPHRLAWSIVGSLDHEFLKESAE